MSELYRVVKTTIEAAIVECEYIDNVIHLAEQNYSDKNINIEIEQIEEGE